MEQHEYGRLGIADRRLTVMAMTELIVAEWRRGYFPGIAAEAAVEWPVCELISPESGFAVLSEAYYEIAASPFKSRQAAEFCRAWEEGEILQWAQKAGRLTFRQ